MAEAIVSAVAEQLIAIIKHQIQNEIHLVRDADKEVLSLSDELTTLKHVLDDAESRRFRDQSITRWLSRLEQTSYEMEDVLDEWNYAIHQLKMEANANAAAPKKKVWSFVPSSSLFFKKVVVRRDIAKKVKKVKCQLDQIIKEKDQYNFVSSLPIAHRLSEFRPFQSTSLIDSANVHGRDKDRDSLVNKLLDSSCLQEELGVHVLSIVRMGGLGKTTLAQLDYNESRVKKSFDLRIWICVSDPFDLAAIARGILESIRSGSSPNTNQLDVLLKHVKMSIAGKRFLLVLDDVWTEEDDKWESLANYLSCGGAGSKVLVTTRSEKVVRMMGSRNNDICRPGLLSDEDCWSLLRRVAHSGRNAGEFEDVGKKIVKRCSGLPLAVKTLGSVLRFKSRLEEWENVLKSEIWKMEKVEVDVFPHLLLSYNELSPTLKRCFSYCAVFPKGTRINVEVLIGNWMALGYLGSDSDDMELIGRECFDVLAMRSLFQDFNTDAFDEKITSCKMHDIVHDFAQFLRKSDRVEGTMETKTNCQTCDPLLVCNVNEFRGLFLNKKDYSPRLCDCLARLRVLSPKNFFDRRGMENLIHLRWLDLSGNELYVFNLTPIFQLYFLQNLRLSNCGLKEIPREIKNLIHLRHLDLSSNWHLEKLPMEIGNLTQLRCLDLRFNRSLKELPESIWGLQELRVLNITSCERLNRVPEGLARLTSLRTLYRFEGGSGWSKLGLLKKLNHLSGSLDLIVRLGDDEVIKDAREAELRNKTKLRQLFISFKDDMDECKNLVRMDAIDALEPHPNLKHLVIDKYKGSKFPLSWIVSPLSQLTYIALSDCKGLTSLPPLGNLPCLEEIRVFGMESLKHVGREFLGSECLSNALAFPKLKKLKFYECSEWKEWEDITPQEEEVSTIMPCLVELTIENCNSLTMLPCSLLSKAWPVKMLDISGSEELQRHCRDNGVVFMVQPKFFDPTFVTS